MAAAVVSRHSNNSSPHLNAKSTMTSSPKSSRVNQLPSSDQVKKESPANTQSQQGTPPRSDTTVPTIKADDTDTAVDDAKDSAAPSTNAPLAPPPRPNQNSGADNQDYFTVQHNQSHLSKEPNPFEAQFGSNPAETPGKPQLPGVTSLTSPASLLPGNTPGWPGSLRSGPLSPAMLTGPTGSSDYFNSDHHFAGSFPTPNESSLRTGLTPGGGGSMFPQPSPNSAAIFQQLQNGGATPGTVEFHRTAMNARAHSQANNNFNMNVNGGTSQPQQNPNIQPDLDSKPYHPPNGQQQDQHDPFSQHQSNEAANGLFMLAQASGNNRSGQQGFAVPQQPQQGYQQGMQHLQQQMGQHSQENSPNMGKRAGKNSIGSTMSGSTNDGQGEYSDSGNSNQAKPQTRSRGKKGSTGKAATNGRRKAEETPIKGQPNKRQKGNNGQMTMPEDFGEEDMEQDDGEEQLGADGKKMTDEEKRKNFLERNRVAALKCRQRKKQWLANLQQKVEIFSTENDALAATVTQLREEIVGLKTLLLAHKDCPVSQAQGISGMAMQNIAGDGQHFANPYGMAGPQGMMQQGMPQANMQRR